MKRPAPESVVWELTRACNLHCVNCGSAAGTKRPAELSADEARFLCRDLKTLGVSRVSLMGGEPLLVPHCLDVLSFLAELSIQTDLVTNGEKLNRDMAFFLREVGAYGVSLSVDGPPNIHDMLRSKRGQFDTVSRAAAWIQEAGLSLGIITHINRDNFDHLEALSEILETWHVDAWQLQLTTPAGAASNSNCVVDLEMLDTLHEWAVEKQSQGLLHLYFADNIGYFHPRDPNLRAGRGALRPWLGCQAGRSTLGIASDGNVRGCMSLPDTFNEANVRERSIVDIWNDKSLFAYNRVGHERFGNCADCVLGTVCGGGCASFSMATTGKIGAMPLCVQSRR